MRAPLWMPLLACLAVEAAGHEWYTGQRDPVQNVGCCGGSDCAEIPAEAVEEQRHGYRITLTADEAAKVHPYTKLPINALVPRARIIPSRDGNFHLCIHVSDRQFPHQGVRCLFVPSTS